MGDNQEITVSAPGKIILTGEHAVSFGKKGLAASLNLRTYVHLKNTKNDAVQLCLPDIGVTAAWELNEFGEKILLSEFNSEPTLASEELIRKLKLFANLDPNIEDVKSLAIVAFLFLYGSTLCSKCERYKWSIKVQVGSWLPPGAGLGSSAAYATCLTAAFLLYSGRIVSKSTEDATSNWSKQDIELINSWAFLVEKIIHGRPSGIDNSVSSHGGVLCFQNGVITPFEKIPLLNVLLVNTRVPRSTKVLVSNVKIKHDKYPTIIGPVLDAIEAISNQTITLLTDDSLSSNVEDKCNSLKELFDMNQRLLGLLGVSHPTLDQIISTANKYGLQGKLTGAGGGGCAFVFITPGTLESAVDSLQAELSQLNFDCWRTTVGGTGVVQHLFANDPIYSPPSSFSAIL